MHRKRLAAALAATTVTAALITAPTVSAQDFVAPGCPDGTISSEQVWHDDFDAETSPSTTWESKPVGAFEVRKHADAGDGLVMHGEHPLVDGFGEARTAPLKFPAGRQLVMVLTHAHALAADAEAAVGLYAELVGFRPKFTGSESGYFRGSAARSTSTADLSVLAGKEVWVSLELSTGSKPPTAEHTGWDVDDVAVYTCDDKHPSGPAGLVIKPGYDEVLTTWEPSAWRPELVTGYQVRLHDVDDSSRDRVVDLGAGARQWRFTGVPPARTYQVSVSSGPADRATSSVRIHPSWVHMTGSRSQTVQFTNRVTITGTAWLQNGSLTLQKRYSSAGSWVNAGGASVSEGRWRADPTPTRNTQYRVVTEPRVYSTFARMGSFSPTFSAKVKMAVDAWSNGFVNPDEPVIIKTRVSPNHPGMSVQLQRYYSDGWRTVSSKRLGEWSSCTFSFHKKPGTYAYRVVAPSHSDHVQGTSQVTRAYVRGY